MSQAFVLCPQTSEPFYIGLNTEWLGIDNIEIGTQETRCPKCGETHAWSADDIILRSDGAG